MQVEFGQVYPGQIAREHIEDCLKRNWITSGPKVELLEKLWNKTFQCKHSCMVSSGTSADMAAFMVLYECGAKPGDEIITPSLSFIATSNAIRAAGFVNKFVDVRFDTLNIDPSQVEQAITNKTVAICAVNLMGKPADLIRLREIADKYNLFLIVDSCESHGALINDKPCLDYCHMATYSMYSAHLVCSAEGGMVCTNDSNMDNILRSIRSHGRNPGSQYFEHLRFGLNFKNTDLHASIGLDSIDNFEETFNTRKSIYYQMLGALSKYKDRCYFVEEDMGCTNSPHAFSITLKDKRNSDFQKLVGSLNDSSIHWKRNFGAIPDHKAFEYMNLKGQFPVAIHIGNFGLHVPCHQYLSESDVDRIIKACEKGLK